MRLNSEDRWLILERAVKEAVIARIFTILRSKGVEPVILKGWASSRYYSNPYKRHLGDIDLAVAPQDFPTVQRALEGRELPKENIDLHCGLRDRELWSWVDIFDRTYLVDVNGVAVRVLGDEDHLRVVATHWLIDGGLNKEKLWDIYYMVANRKSDFDWNLCLESPNPNRTTWVLAAVATARDFLGLEVSDLPVEVQNFKLPKWYVQTLQKEWGRGLYVRMPIPNSIVRPKVLFQQFYRRFPPNPIAATTDTEGPIDESARWPYQLRSIKKKLINASPFARKD